MKEFGVLRMIYWESDCGHKGSISTRSEALAPLVRESRKDHDRRFPKCDMVDIQRVEGAAEREARLKFQPTSEGLASSLGGESAAAESAGDVA